jgi:hypothetical protein
MFLQIPNRVPKLSSLRGLKITVAETAILMRITLLPIRRSYCGGRDFLEVTTPTFAFEFHGFAGKLQFRAST